MLNPGEEPVVRSSPTDLGSTKKPVLFIQSNTGFFLQEGFRRKTVNL